MGWEFALGGISLVDILAPMGICHLDGLGRIGVILNFRYCVSS